MTNYWEDDKNIFAESIQKGGAPPPLHMGSFPQDGENEQNLSYFFSSLELYCGQTVIFFSSFLNCSEEIMSVPV